MNRLVIIGNGFDLAHGLPTSYRDFIEDYFIEAIDTFFKNRIYEDELISIKYRQSISFNSTPIFKSIEQVFDFIKMQSNYIEINYHSSFFKGLKDKIDKLNWVDVENEYFEEIKKSRYRVSGEYDFVKIEKLNSDFEFLKKLLEKYLSKIVKNFNSAISPNKFSRIFNDLIFKDEVLLKDLENDIYPENILVLNFNYTSIVEASVNNVKNIPIEINYIHGMLNYESNAIIFGFGDEYDKDYKEFEEKKNNILFKHIKSFEYFKTQNYHNLIRFVESDDYQVTVLGHSCGLSDRTMLKEIFENDKCISIKIFYYRKPDSTNDYVEKTMEISRHFEDKGLMRKKIVSFPLSKSM